MVLLSQILVFIFGVSFWFASGNQNQRAIGATLEDCDFYTPKAKPGRCQPYECWGDGHYECKSCLHYKPEPVSDELS